MNYTIISTGSKGNCVLTCEGRIMIDCGVPFKLIKEYLYDVDVLLLTHIHSDHIRPATLKAIREKFPHITVVGNYEVYQTYDIDFLCNATHPFEVSGYTFRAFECVHDVVTYGYAWEYDGKSIIYATDTSTLEHAPPGEYDYLFLESNHCEDKIRQIQFSTKFGYNAYAGAKRHLSTQQARAWYYMNRRSKESELIELHQSARFY